MLLDDGIVRVYELVNVSDPGDKPVYWLGSFSDHAFGYETVGINRYYTAMEAKRQIDELIRIHIDREIFPDTHIAEILTDTGGHQFRIVQVQHLKDEDELWCSKLSLERLHNGYPKQINDN